MSTLRHLFTDLLSKEDNDEKLILQSGLFDASYYAGTSEARDLGLDPVEHYMRVGEGKGLMPSACFDPWYYASLRPDAVGSSLLLHYIRHRLPDGELPFRPLPSLPSQSLDPNCETVLIVIHEATRTGAPILGWNIATRFSRSYNVIVLLMKGGELAPHFDEVAHVVIIADMRADLSAFISEIVFKYSIDFVIANSVATRDYAVEFSRKSVPVILLVHEFAELYPKDSLAEIYKMASSIVFPAEIVRKSSLLNYNFLNERETVLLPQGPSFIPGSRVSEDKTTSNITAIPQSVLSACQRLRPAGYEKAFLVVGLGYVDYRKGVDLFIAAATEVRKLASDLPIRFVWVGDGFRPETDTGYSAYLQFQIRQSGLGDRIEIMNAVVDLEPVYAETQALLLTSRLDPLPNVALDCVLRGIPVVTFEDTNGMAEILGRHQETRRLVAAYQDVRGAAEIIVDLASRPTSYSDLSARLKEVATGIFDMATYVQNLAALGEAAAEAKKPQQG